MTNSAQDHGQQKPETVEDLAPREDETAELKGGSLSWGDRAGAGRKAGGEQ
jgi:hypothetical protein